MIAKIYKLTLQIQLENAAFEEDKAAETARILRRLADRLESGAGEYCPKLNNREPADGWLFDANGNVAGDWKTRIARYNV